MGEAKSNILEKLSFIKEYSAFLLPGIIFLIAIVLFVPSKLMSSKLGNKMEAESVSQGQKVKGFAKSAVAAKQWEVEQAYQLAYERDANQISQLAIQSSQRELLSYQIFPKPKGTSALLFENFGISFRESIDGLMIRSNARDCPTEFELEQSLQKGKSSRNRKRSLKNLNDVDATIQDVLCRSKAESSSVYINPGNISGYDYWRTGEGRVENKEGGDRYEYVSIDESVKECWFWQLGYWISEDVVDAINTANSGSKNVFTSPVKRILSLGYDTDKSSSLGSRKKKGEGVKPSYVISSKDGLVKPCTGRKCDPEIDVVHFSIELVIDTKAVLPFIQELCSGREHKFSGWTGANPEITSKHNQITVLSCKIGTIDREDKDHELYRYGESPVVELDLICEYIFNKTGYDEIKPEQVKKLFEESDEDY